MEMMSLALQKPLTSLQVMQLAFYSFVIVTGTIGNGWVIKMIYKDGTNPGSRFIIALALVDMISSIWVPFLWIHWIIYEFQGDQTTLIHWPYGKSLCLIMWPWFPSVLFASAWLLFCISLERTR